MKYLIGLLIVFFTMFSCKKITNKSDKINSNQASINNQWNGDKLISDLDFVSQINTSCLLTSSYFNRSEEEVKQDNLKCVLSKINFDYSKLDSLKGKKIIGNLNNSLELYIEKTTPKNLENADIYNQVTLFVKKGEIIMDSMIIYESINYIEALTVKQFYYYIDNNKIFLLNLSEDESGSSVKDWSEYYINESGKIKLVKNKKAGNTKIEKKPSQIENAETTKSTNLIGSFKIYADAISNNTKEKVSLGYFITIKSLTKAVLSIDAKYSEDYGCEGEYRLIDEKSILHAKGKCDQDDVDDFYLKYDNGKCFIRSKRFINQDWLELIRE
ncbi:hypothetical protein PYS58_22290 [Chryseobacterium indologenes]|uniref:hypothetical protein n=1 Tax=Chryseobacterium indologenes TaxID=253 RepID=UPI0023E8276F|nr:hypothetical protein [Chryseobacterium indologenes]WET49250.1 hypothetical protein PYS58_22290 [Chryseobacterium indologenes]